MQPAAMTSALSSDGKPKLERNAKNFSASSGGPDDNKGVDCAPKTFSLIVRLSNTRVRKQDCFDYASGGSVRFGRLLQRVNCGPEVLTCS